MKLLPAFIATMVRFLARARVASPQECDEQVYKGQKDVDLILVGREGRDRYKLFGGHFLVPVATIHLVGCTFPQYTRKNIFVGDPSPC